MGFCSVGSIVGILIDVRSSFLDRLTGFTFFRAWAVRRTICGLQLCFFSSMFGGWSIFRFVLPVSIA